MDSRDRSIYFASHRTQCSYCFYSAMEAFIFLLISYIYNLNLCVERFDLSANRRINLIVFREPKIYDIFLTNLILQLK